MKILSAVFVRGAVRREDCPAEGIPEVAFAGRSNVGKSSLINALLGRKGLARTSAMPGRTREIHFYRINSALFFVDLPGYGYAKAPLDVRRRWRPMVEGYLRERKNLRLVVLLFDPRREPATEDLGLVAWLRERGIPCRVVLAKGDKLSRNERARRGRFLRERFALPPGEEPLFFSARTGEGKDMLWRIIRERAGLEIPDPSANGLPQPSCGPVSASCARSGGAPRTAPPGRCGTP